MCCIAFLFLKRYEAGCSLHHCPPLLNSWKWEWKVGSVVVNSFCPKAEFRPASEFWKPVIQDLAKELFSHWYWHNTAVKLCRCNILICFCPKGAAKHYAPSAGCWVYLNMQHLEMFHSSRMHCKFTWECFINAHIWTYKVTKINLPVTLYTLIFTWQSLNTVKGANRIVVKLYSPIIQIAN